MEKIAKGHPKGLYVLFFSEAWERFSFYGMRALLVLYLVNQLKYERSHALSVYALYLGLVYLTPVLGGYLADRLLGARKAIIIGGILMAIGHLTMAFPTLIFVGMGLIIAGNGFFKPNISTIVGSLYEENDPRRDGGFTIFYMGINLGAMLAPLVCGYLGEEIGWEYGFSAASVGMVCGLAVFLSGQTLVWHPATGGIFSFSSAEEYWRWWQFCRSGRLPARSGKASTGVLRHWSSSCF
jgi:POT family proton-dependent oligopeptide transporter